MSLSLSGNASRVLGLAVGSPPSILRLRSLDRCATGLDPSDVALARSAPEVEAAFAKGFNGAVLTSDEQIHLDIDLENRRLIIMPRVYDYLADGDIIGISAQSQRFRTLYRRQSPHNSFLVTERCNHYCLMCSQPPRNVNDGWLLDEISLCLPLIEKDTLSLGFTGGEPLLEWKRFIEILAQCRNELPQTAIHVLTNGRAFVQNEVVAAWAALNHPDLMAGIPTMPPSIMFMTM